MEKTRADGLPLPQRYGAILTIIIGISMAVLDGAIANVALPTIATDLHASPASSIWIVNAYQIAIVVSLLSLSFLGDMFGYRRIYKCGLVVFLLSSLFCALSDSLQMLTLARIAQGFGGAALMSVNTALIRLIYPQRHLGRGMGINSFIVAVSSAAGPTIAAAILSISSWKWLFLINVPLGIIALILAIRFLPANIAHDTKPRFDLPSAVMNALTFGLLVTALSGFAQGQPLTLIGAELLVLVVVGFFFVRRQLSLPVPLLPIDLLRIPLFSLSIGTSICSFCAQMLAMVSLPFYLQTVLGRSRNRPVVDALAAGNDGDGAAGWIPDRTSSCRFAGGAGNGDNGRRVVCSGHAARLPLRSEYYLADDPLRRGVWPVSVAE